MKLKVDPEFKARLPIKTPEEYARFREAIQRDGVITDSIKVWFGHDIILDGHHRFQVAQELGLPFEVTYIRAADRRAALSWMRSFQFERRNMTPEQMLAHDVLFETDVVPNHRVTPSAIRKAKALKEAGRDDLLKKVADGDYSTLAAAYNDHFRNSDLDRKPKAREPRPPVEREPSTAGKGGPGAVVPIGHRVKGYSTLRNSDGETEHEWTKTERDSDDPPRFEPVGEGFAVKGVSTLLDGQGKVRAQWVSTNKPDADLVEQFFAACERHVASYRGLAEMAERPPHTDADTLTIYPLGDPHIGMLAWKKEVGESFDLEIATRDLVRTIDLLVDRAPASNEAILANLGDFFHAEDDTQLTPTGKNKLDVDCRFGKVTDVGFALLRRLVDRLLGKHQIVEVRNVPGNHDPKMARMLAMWLAAVYEREPRVRVVPNLNPYSYHRFGANLFGFAHGDGAKPQELPAIMASDCPTEWGETEFRLWLTGHIHHETCKEFRGCSVESFRTLAGRDYWHHHKGYRAGRSLSAITFHKDYGEITRATVDLKLARAA